MEDLGIDPSRYRRITEIYRVGPRCVEALLGERHFRVTAVEKLSDRESPLFSSEYEKRIDVIIDEECLPIWVEAGLGWVTGDTPGEVIRAGLDEIDKA
jgi:hypothetical protein